MALQILAALVLIAHGIGHIVGVLTPWFGVDANYTNKPWVLQGAQPLDSLAGRAWGVFWMASLVLFVGSVIGVFMDEKWWRTLAIVGSGVSIIAIVPWFNTVMVRARMEAALDVAILLVLLLPWGEKVTDFFGVP